MTALLRSSYQFFGANSQDRRCRVDHLEHEDKIKVQMSSDRNESSRRPKTAADGLPPNTKGWTARRKTTIVEAVPTGAISRGEVCCRHGRSANGLPSQR